MRRNSSAMKFGAAFAASGVLLSSTAYAAPTSVGRVDPLVALSVFGTSSSRAALCAAGAQAAAGAAASAGAAATGQAGLPCGVLPVVDAAPQPVVQGPVVVDTVAEGGGLGMLPILLGAVAVAGLAFLLLRDNDEDDEDDDGEPVSPD